MDDSNNDEVKFSKNKRLMNDTSGHVGGPLYRKPFDPLDSPKLNKRGMSFDE